MIFSHLLLNIESINKFVFAAFCGLIDTMQKLSLETEKSTAFFNLELYHCVPQDYSRSKESLCESQVQLQHKQGCLDFLLQKREICHRNELTFDHQLC